MNKKRIIIFILSTGIVLASCGTVPEGNVNAEIEKYKAQIASLEESVIKLNEEVTVKDNLIAELREDEMRIDGLEARKRDAAGFNKELAASVKQNNNPDAYRVQGPFSGNYSIEMSLRKLGLIENALKDFSELTGIVRERELLTGEELESVGNTDESTQRVGFSNMPISIEGQLMEQNYIIKTLDLKWAIAMYELGRTGRKELDDKFEQYLNAKGKYQNFLDNTYYADESGFPRDNQIIIH